MRDDTWEQAVAKASKATQQAPSTTLAQKIDHLFSVVRAPGGEFTHEQVATAIEQSGGPKISATYVWQLRKGLRNNPTIRHLEALSGFFGVPAAYFLDDDTTAAVDTDLEVLTAVREPAVRELAVLANGLSPETLSTVADMIRRARQLEGLDGVPTAKPARRRK